MEPDTEAIEVHAASGSREFTLDEPVVSAALPGFSHAPRALLREDPPG